MQQVGATPPCRAAASHCSGFSYCGARPLGARALLVAARGLSSCSVRLSGHTGSAVEVCSSQGMQGQQLQRVALRARRVSSCRVRLSGHTGSAVAACGSQGTRAQQLQRAALSTKGQQLQRAALRARRVSSCSLRLSGHSGSAVVATGLVAPWHVKCSWTQD